MSQKIKILFPIDFSDHTENAFSTALHLCQVYDAEMFMLHVLEAPSGAVKLFSSFDEGEARKKVNQMMDNFIKEHGDDAIIFNKMIKLGKPYRKILEAANMVNCTTQCVLLCTGAGLFLQLRAAGADPHCKFPLH